MDKMAHALRARAHISSMSWTWILHFFFICKWIKIIEKLLLKAEWFFLRHSIIGKKDE